MLMCTITFRQNSSLFDWTTSNFWYTVMNTTNSNPTELTLSRVVLWSWLSVLKKFYYNKNFTRAHGCGDCMMYSTQFIFNNSNLITVHFPQRPKKVISGGTVSYRVNTKRYSLFVIRVIEKCELRTNRERKIIRKTHNSEWNTQKKKNTYMVSGSENDKWNEKSTIWLMHLYAVMFPSNLLKIYAAKGRQKTSRNIQCW